MYVDSSLRHLFLPSYPYYNKVVSTLYNQWLLLPPTLFGNLPPLLSSIWRVNVIMFVTTVLTLVDDYLSRETQFSSFLVIHQLKGMIDVSIHIPPRHIIVSRAMQQPNPTYYLWVGVNHVVNDWLKYMI